tara:strand:- start:29 stop:373 length:345 start_codon:yes stop_codon:yes gene_type:complete
VRPQDTKPLEEFLKDCPEAMKPLNEKYPQDLQLYNTIFVLRLTVYLLCFSMGQSAYHLILKSENTHSARLCFHFILECRHGDIPVRPLYGFDAPNTITIKFLDVYTFNYYQYNN